MKSFRFSGSPSEVTCSAEIRVPWMTSRSMPALTRIGVSSRQRCGLTRTAVIAPDSRSSVMRLRVSLITMFDGWQPVTSQVR